MSTYTTKQLTAVTTLTTSAATMYTAPASTTTTVKTILLSNYSAADVQATVYLIPSGGTAANGNAILGSVNVAANTTTVIDTAVVMPAASFIQAKASAGTALNIHISGIEIS